MTGFKKSLIKYITTLIISFIIFGVLFKEVKADNEIKNFEVQLEQIEELKVILNSLEKEIKNNSSCYSLFYRDLKLFNKGEDVLSLQKILNSVEGQIVAEKGEGSQGQETIFFGTLTEKAVISFQEKFASDILSPVGLNKGTGYVGVLTRAKLVEVCNFNNSLVTNNLKKIRDSLEKIEKTIKTLILESEKNSKENKEEKVKKEEREVSKETVEEKSYPIHTNITAAIFWVGEPVGNGSSEDNALSAWDDEWMKNFGGFDDPFNRNGYYPAGFTPKENPFYLDLPYNDFDDNGNRKNNVEKNIPWANEKEWGRRESMMKNQWVKITHQNITCFGQIQDAGPYQYDDVNYVFGENDERPKSKIANNAGMDISPALRDCLGFVGKNNVDNKVSWQFVKESQVPNGPWKEIITTSQINWPE